MRSLPVPVALLLIGLLPAVLPVARPAQAQKPPPSSALVFDGVTVVDVERGKLVPGQRVVVVGARIQAVGDERAIALPAGAQVIDARSKYLIPGLWDMHVHVYDGYAYPFFIANGITGVRFAIGGDPLPDQVRRRQAILDGTLVGPPRQLLTGPPINSFIEGVVGGRERLRGILDSLRAAGADMIKVYPLELDVAAEIRKAGLPFGGHLQPSGVGAAVGVGVPPIEASDSGMRILDHVYVSGLKLPCLGETRSVEQCQPIAQAFQRNGTWLVPTLTVQDEIFPTLIGRITPASVPLFARLKALADVFWWEKKSVAVHGNWLRDATNLGLPPMPRPDSTADTVRYLALVQRLGLPVLAGTDTPAFGGSTSVIPGFSLHAELAMYVAEGFTPLHALQSATLDPAKFLHGTDSLGTVAAGKLADLVLLDADPLADITNTTTIRAVVANGRYFDRDALDHLLTR